MLFHIVSMLTNCCASSFRNLEICTAAICLFIMYMGLYTWLKMLDALVLCKVVLHFPLRAFWAGSKRRLESLLSEHTEGPLPFECNNCTD